MEQTIGYARFLRRLQALYIDALIIPVAAFLISYISSFPGVHGYGYAIIAGIVVFTLEPVLVSFTGATVGQHLVGIQVQNKLTGKKLNLLSASVRFMIKIFLGLFSLIAIFNTKYHQAIHDSLVGSVVVVKDPGEKPGFESIPVRTFQKEGYHYPSKLRLIIMVVVYTLFDLLLFAFLIYYFLSQQCTQKGWCSNQDIIQTNFLELIWFFSVPYIIFLCRRGKLIGCRQKPEVKE